MDGVDLILEAERAGLTVHARGDKLVVRGPKRLEPLAKALLANKPLIMSALRNMAAPVPEPPTIGPTCPRHLRGGVVDVPIHGGLSVRRDCRQCGRFIEFILWYGASRN